MIHDELAGKLVLVHPDLEHDPAEKQNEIGEITYADTARDDIFVRFEDGAQGLYSTDALLTLMPTEDIHRNVAGLDYDIAFKDIKSLTRIELFLRYGSDEKQLVALELARDNKQLQQYCLETLENCLNLQQSRGYE